MNGKRDKLLVYFDDEAHLVRRLGAAVISCWAELPMSIRSKLIDMAKRVLDEDEDEDVDRQIVKFIADHDASH